MECRNKSRKAGYWVTTRRYSGEAYTLEPEFVVDRSTLHYCECERCAKKSNLLPKDKVP